VFRAGFRFVGALCQTVVEALPYKLMCLHVRQDPGAERGGKQGGKSIPLAKFSSFENKYF